jgi:hypothetical protein
MLDYLLQERMNRMNRMNKVASMTAANRALGGVLGASPKASILQRVLAKLSGLADDAGAVATRQGRLANVGLHKGKKAIKAGAKAAGSAINAGINSGKDAATKGYNATKGAVEDAAALASRDPKSAALLMGASGTVGAGAGVGVDELIRALAAKKEQA